MDSMNYESGSTSNPDKSLDQQYQAGLADIWDELINWNGRAEGEKGFFKNLLKTQGAQRVLDAACGTGYHTIDLSEAGFDVTASDNCPKMLRKARINAAASGCSCTFVCADWRELEDLFGEPFDAILCLGSSLPHLHDKDDRIKALNQFHRILKPGGILVVDHRNFDALLAGNFAGKGKFYYCSKTIHVSARIAPNGMAEFTYSKHSNHTLQVYPLRTNELRMELERTGFRSIRSFGDFVEGEITLESDFVIHVATKGT